MARGQTGKFETIEDLNEAIDGYFKSLEYKCPDTGLQMNAPATITGLALALGFCSRQSIYDYEGKPNFSYTIKKARLRVENSYEQHLFTKSATGAIFGLKNLGWSDKVEVEAHNTNLNTDLTEEEKEKVIKRVEKGLNEFDDYDD